MKGLYIHIPFCKQKCVYCDFLSGTNIGLADRYIGALKKEPEYYHQYRNEPIRTLYFGGGTPTILSTKQLAQIYDILAAAFDLSRVEEFTIECNPDNLTTHYLQQLRESLPVNRLSIGIQSFNDEQLQWMGRSHTAKQGYDAVVNAKKAGFDNISIDLIFALPNQSLQSLEESVDIALSLDTQHISLYSLMFEEGSKITRLGIEPADEELSRQQFELIMTKLKAAGYEHYEISNYAKSGYRSKHNSLYWEREKYLGLGAGAHSFDGERRWSNIAHTLKYCASLEEGKYEPLVEQLTEEESFNEALFLGLRTREGVDLDSLRAQFDPQWVDEMMLSAVVSLERGTLLFDGKRLTLSEKGLYISDSIMSELMRVG